MAADSSKIKELFHTMNNSQSLRSAFIDVYHTDKSSGSNVKYNEELAHLDVFAELLILIESTCIVTSRSGFSDLAVHLSSQAPNRCAIPFDSCDNDSVKNAVRNILCHTLR